MSQVELNSRLGPPGWDRGREPRAKASSRRATRNGRRRFPFRVLAPGPAGNGAIAINTCPKTGFVRTIRLQAISNPVFPRLRSCFLISFRMSWESDSEPLP
jgi:hypothetical protein